MCFFPFVFIITSTQLLLYYLFDIIHPGNYIFNGKTTTHSSVSINNMAHFVVFVGLSPFKTSCLIHYHHHIINISKHALRDSSPKNDNSVTIYLPSCYGGAWRGNSPIRNSLRPSTAPPKKCLICGL